MVAPVGPARNMQFLVISTAFILTALSTRGSATADSFFNWWATDCKNYQFANPVLSASCKKTDQMYDSTSINLDKCVTNNNGVLYCGTK